MRSEDIPIPEPCDADWDSMRPEERGKFCSECSKKVHDLSSMTKNEAEGFLQRSACEDICVSFEHDEQGTLQFRAPRPAPVVPLSRLRHPRKVAAAVMGVGMAAALAACAPHGEAPARVYKTEASVQIPTVVIPHGNASEATPVPPPVVEDEPCDPEPAVEPTTRRVKGGMRRTAGKPVMRKPMMRKTGDIKAPGPLAEL